MERTKKAAGEAAGKGVYVKVDVNTEEFQSLLKRIQDAVNEALTKSIHTV
ncbi:hypothetical protein [Bilophila wadsworthia]